MPENLQTFGKMEEKKIGDEGPGEGGKVTGGHSRGYAFIRVISPFKFFFDKQCLNSQSKHLSQRFYLRRGKGDSSYLLALMKWYCPLPPCASAASQFTTGDLQATTGLLHLLIRLPNSASPRWAKRKQVQNRCRSPASKKTTAGAVLWTMVGIRIRDFWVLRLWWVMMGSPSQRPSWERWFLYCSKDCSGVPSLLHNLLHHVLGHLCLLDLVHLDSSPLSLWPLVAQSIRVPYTPDLWVHHRRVRAAGSHPYKLCLHARHADTGSLFVSQCADPPFPHPIPCQHEHPASAAGSFPSLRPSLF